MRSFVLMGLVQTCVAITYPHYLQCDPSWAKDPMGPDGKDICRFGCARSCVAMGLAAHNISIPGESDSYHPWNAKQLELS